MCRNIFQKTYRILPIHGVRKNNKMKRNFTKRNKKQNSVAVLVYVFYPDLVDEMLDYLNRIPFDCDVYISAPSFRVIKKCKKGLLRNHTIIVCKHVDGGMDVGPFFRQLQQILRSNKKYKYYLKIHSKQKKRWRREMFESCLPKGGYQKIFSILDRQHIAGSEKYLLEFSHATRNSDLILSQIKKYNLGIQEKDLYDTVSGFNPDTASFDPIFYSAYHCDLKMYAETLRGKGMGVNEAMDNHWKTVGKTQARRVPNESLIEHKAQRSYKFFAGTVFWFDDLYLEYLLQYTDSFEEMNKKISQEKGYVVNSETTYTHHLEYWFGLLASHMNYPKEIKGISSQYVINDDTEESNAWPGTFLEIKKYADMPVWIHFKWQKYLMYRKDILRRWNGPKRAFVHYVLFGRSEIKKAKSGASVSKQSLVYRNKWKQDWRRKVLQNKSLYIHIPKCAGTSIDSVMYEKPLVRFDDETGLWVQHLTVDNAEKYYFSKKEMDSLFVFTVVRNPFDRFVSTYNWLCSVENIPTTKKTFRDFVFHKGVFKRLLDKDNQREWGNYYHHLIPQIDYVQVGNKKKVDYIVKFENLNKEWKVVCNKIGLDEDLPFLNRVSHKHYSYFFDGETKGVVEKMYKKDLEYFEYVYEDKSQDT